MIEKQKQEVGDNSQAIQVNGDYVVKVDYHEIREIFMDLFNLNFPQIQAIAKEEANSRINQFMCTFENKLSEHQDRIDTSKFNDPGIQYEMCNMIKNAARFGDKSNIDELCEVFNLILEKDCADIFQLIIIQTLETLPQINKKHLLILALASIIYPDKLKLNSKTLDEANFRLGKIFEYIGDIGDISWNEINYLECVKCISIDTIDLEELKKTVLNAIEGYDKKTSVEIKNKAKESNLYNIIKMYEYIEKYSLSLYNLTEVGRLIGMVRLKPYMNFNLNKVFKQYC